MSSEPQLRISFPSIDAMRTEYQRNLRAGGAFCAGVRGYVERTLCELVLVHPLTRAELVLPAEVVFVKPDEPGMGVGLHVRDFGPSVQQKLMAFLESAPSEPASTGDAPADDAELQEVREDNEGRPAAATALQERLRAMSLTAQLRLAREGSLTERVALERMLGKAVWEAILQNQRVSPPEVARIARMGTATSALLDTIVGNAAWLSSGEVRRALLSNPRLSEEGVTRVLRATGKPELRLICQQTSHQPRVRKIAKTLLGGAG